MRRRDEERPQNTRDRERQLLNLFLRDGWQDARSNWNARCHWCNVALSWRTAVKDRLLPYCLGGRYRLENLVLSCSDCNIRRPDTFPPEPPPRWRGFGRTAVQVRRATGPSREQETPKVCSWA